MIFWDTSAIVPLLVEEPSTPRVRDMVREHADNLLLRHPLRAADALQLGAAITLAQGRPRGHRFATLDLRLADAALGEGFDLVFPDLD